MPVYVFKCPECSEVREEVRRMRDRNIDLPDCPGGCGTMKRAINLEGKSNTGIFMSLEIENLINSDSIKYTTNLFLHFSHKSFSWRFVFIYLATYEGVLMSTKACRTTS